MTVRLEKLEASAAPLISIAVLGLVSTMATLLVRWWRQPAPLVMSEDWVNDRARSDAYQGWY
jgi:hypothetical protein